MRSRKRSAPSSASTPPPEIVFLLDRSLGRFGVAVGLRAAGVRAEIHDDHLAQDATDETWLSLAGSRDWVVLTKDKRIRFRRLEKDSLLAAGLRTFVFTAASATGAQTAAAFVAALPRMLRLARARPGPWIATVSRDGSVRLLDD